MTAYDYLVRVSVRIYERWEVHALRSADPRSLGPRDWHWGGYRAVRRHLDAHPELADIGLPVEVYESDGNQQLALMSGWLS